MRITKRESLALMLIGLFILPILLPQPQEGTTPLETAVNVFSPSSIGWYNSNWHFRRSISISGSSGAGTDYQIKITLLWNASLRSDFGDLRFTESDGTTLLNYWIEGYTIATSATVWIKVSDDLGTSTNIYMYYGNKGATSESNGTNTFAFFDDFNDGVLNTTRYHAWNGATGTPAEAGGIFTLTTASGWSSYGSYEQFGENIAMGFYTKISAESTYWVIGLDQRTYDGSGNQWTGVNNNGGTRYYSSSDGTVTNVARYTAYTVYKKIEIQRFSSRIEFFEGLVSMANVTTHLPSADLGVSILNQNAHVQYWDYLYIRNCIDVEPVATIGSQTDNMNVHAWPNGTWVQNATYIIDETSGTNEPTVIYEGNPQILTSEDYVYKMWYRVGWTAGTITIYYAESADGYTWTKYSGNPVLSAGNHYCPFVLKHDGVYYMWVDNGPWHGDTMYNSSNGINWAIMNGGDEVISIGTGDTWDNASIGNVAVFVNSSGIWNMVYEAYGTGSFWKLGLATSTNGTTWTKYSGNPVLSRTGSSGGPSIVTISGTYFMFFHSSESGSLPTEIYMSSSTDLIHWTVPIHVMARVYDWEGVGSGSGQVADPHVIFVNGQILMFYTGVSAQSVGNQHIGIAVLESNLDTWAVDMLLIFIGLVLVVCSGCYMAYGIRRSKTISLDTGFFVLVLFMFGWALFFGGIM